MHLLRHLIRLGVLLGCITMFAAKAAAAEELAALIIQPTEQSRAALQQVLNQTLNRESVRIADNALMQDSVLIVEAARVRDQQGQVVYDREVRAVEHFRLAKVGQMCVLIRESTRERFTLAHTRCVAKP